MIQGRIALQLLIAYYPIVTYRTSNGKEEGGIIASITSRFLHKSRL